MFKTLVNAFKIKDLRKKILITLGLLISSELGVLWCALVSTWLTLWNLKPQMEQHFSLL